MFASRSTVNSSPWALVVLPLCFLLSGYAGIVYQIAWTRQFALVFGTTEVAVAVVLAVYMAGLALGGWLIQRALPFIERPALTYAVLELLIAATAVVAVPTILSASDTLLRVLAGHRPDPPPAEPWMVAFYATAAFVALAIPTLCMGATLPLLTRHLVEIDRQTGPRVGLLYALNAAGAVAGAVAAGRWMLPHLGLTRTVWAAAALNVLAALFSLPFSRRLGRRGSSYSAAWAAAGRASFGRPPAPAWILPLMLVSGAVALLHEVLWTRLLTHMLGSSLNAFGVMLASFLGGLSLGSAAGALLGRERRWAVAGFAVSQLACGLAAITAYVLVNRLLSDKTGPVSAALLAVGILVPIAFFSGATFPLAVRVLARRTEDAASATARVYAWNTLGAIGGTLAGGFILIPSLRFEGSIQAAVLGSLALSVCSTLLLQKNPRALPIGVGVLVVATALLFSPRVPIALLRTSPLQISNTGRMLYYGIGKSSSVVVLEQDGALAVRTNGLPEALVEARGAAPLLNGEKWLVPLVVITHPQATNLLLVGYGGGVILEGVPESVQRMDVIEIEPRVIDANSAMRSLRRQDPLADRRVRVIINDARVSLGLTDRRYDAIVSQPSHPWTAAASHLYTREFLLQARAHLADDGVFVQWLNISFIDEALLRSFAATVLDVFADASLYRPDPFTLIFVAGKQATAPAAPVEALPQFGINTPEDIFVALAADGQALRRMSQGAPLITDDRNRMATTTAYSSGMSMTPATADRLLAPYDPLAVKSFGSNLDRGYIARRLALFSALHPGARNRLDTLAAAMDASSASAYAVNAVKLSFEGDPDAAQEWVQQGLARYPQSDQLRFQYLRPWLTRLARGTATHDVSLEATKLTRSADAVVRGSGLASQNRWDELSALDAPLGEAAWSDSWKLDAITLQVQWRCHKMDSAQLQRRWGEEALTLTDQAITAQPAIMLYALRVQSALAAGRPDAVVESIWAYGHGLFASAELADRAATQAALKELLHLLDQQARPGGSGPDPARVAEVRAGLLRDLHELSHLSAPGD